MKEQNKEPNEMNNEEEVNQKDNINSAVQEENTTLSSNEEKTKENELNTASETKKEDTISDGKKEDTSSQTEQQKPEEKVEEQDDVDEKINTNNKAEKQEANREQTIKEEYITENKTEQEEEKKKTDGHKEKIKNEKAIGQKKDIKTKEPSQSSKKSKKALPIIITIAVIIFIAMFFSIIFALLNMNNNKIIEGISVLGIDVSNLTVEEATNQINTAIQERFSDENNTLILKRGEEETSVTANTFNATFDVDAAIAEAYNIGRDGNIITNNYAILWTKMAKKDIQPTLYLDEELLNSTIKDISSKMKDRVVENSYYVEDEELIIVRGTAGYIIKEDELKNKIHDQISNIHVNYQVVEIPVEYKEPDSIDLQKIRNEIYKEPQDAYVEKNPTTVHTHVNGVDFGISMEEAEELIKEDKEEYTIPLKITEPEKKLEDLGEEAFPDQLATFSTIYDASNYNRSTNIELAAEKINGTVVMPGENFSFNTVVGKRTVEAGYKEGTAYIGGKVVPDIGGGVCQVSSTLYNTALLANLEIVERSNHLFLTGYVAASRDATVYYGSLDFIFKNTRSYPIKVVASAENGVCKISMYGIREETEYEVIIQSKVTSYINYTTSYENDSSLEKGKEVVEQTGVNGCRSEGYRILKLNGKVVSQTLLSKDTYSAREKIVRRGTKQVSNTNSEE